jgi:putative MATE family efflux protein
LDKPAAGSSGRESLVRRITVLALPALVVLAAEPLYLLFDIAVVGRLGAVSLAGLAVGGLVLTLVSSQMTFLSYGTTARSARFHGTGDRDAAVREGVQASWLAAGIGVLVVIAVQLAATPLTSAIGGGGAIAAAALPWLRIAIFAAPAILISLAGNGWMRGVQDTARPLRYVLVGFSVSALLCPLLVYGWLGMPRWGLAGSAVANLVGQWITAVLFCGALVSERVGLRPDPVVLRAQWPSRRVSSPPRRWRPGSGRRRWRPTRWCCSCGVSLRWCWTRLPLRPSRWSVLLSAVATSGARRKWPRG